MQEINLYDLMRHYARYWAFILAITLVGFISGVVYNNFVQKPLYKSNATLILIDASPTTTVKDPTIINNYIELLKSRRVLEPVIQNLKLHQSYEQLAESISTSNDKDTQVVKVSISSKDSNSSKKAVDGAVASFRAEVKRLYNKDNIQVVDSASTPTLPYNVHKGLQLVLFTAAGFLTAIIIVFFIYDFNLNRITAKRTERVRDANGRFIPATKRKTKSKKKK